MFVGESGALGNSKVKMFAFLLIQGKPEEVITIYARDAYVSRQGWLLLAAGILFTCGAVYPQI